MKWTWQLKDFPNFIYDQNVILAEEQQYLKNVGRISAIVNVIEENEMLGLKIDLLTQEAIATSSIEGEILNRESVQSSIKRQLGISSNRKNVDAKEAGIAELMLNVYTNYNQKLSKKILCDWHKMILNGRRDLEVIGDYRKHKEPMQIVSGNLSNQKIFYIAPPSSELKEEMKRFITWYNNTLNDLSCPNLVFAGIAHLYFEILHPFEDGNGRIGRALVEKSLSQRNNSPTLNSFAKVIEMKKKLYYNELQKCNTSLDITSWLKYFSKSVLDAQDYTFKLALFIINKNKFFKKHNLSLNERQEKVLLRVFHEGIDGFKGGLSAGNYQVISATSPATATRDLSALVDIGALSRNGDGKHTRYFLNLEDL